MAIEFDDAVDLLNCPLTWLRYSAEGFAYENPTSLEEPIENLFK